MESSNKVVIRNSKPQNFIKNTLWQEGSPIFVHGYLIKSSINNFSGESRSASVTMRNISSKSITAVRFTVAGLDSFGVLVQTKEVSLVEIHVKTGELFGFNNFFELDNSIVELKIEMSQVAFEDRSVADLENNPLIDINKEIKQINSNNENGLAIIEYYWSSIGTLLPYLNSFQQLQQGWICACGQLNINTNDSCCNCKVSKRIVNELNLQVASEYIDKISTHLKHQFMDDFDKITNSSSANKMGLLYAFERRYLSLDPILKVKVQDDIKPLVDHAHQLVIDYEKSLSKTNMMIFVIVFTIIIILGLVLVIDYNLRN